MLELKGIARQVGSMQFIADKERPVISSQKQQITAWKENTVGDIVKA